MDLSNEGWTKKDLPTELYALCFYGILVGSQAEARARGLRPFWDRDWDILIPYQDWRRAAMHIPKTARPNGNRGWRFGLYVGEGTFAQSFSVDVWPDDLQRFFTEATKGTDKQVYAYSLKTGILYTAQCGI